MANIGMHTSACAPRDWSQASEVGGVGGARQWRTVVGYPTRTRAAIIWVRLLRIAALGLGARVARRGRRRGAVLAYCLGACVRESGRQGNVILLDVPLFDPFGGLSGVGSGEMGLLAETGLSFAGRVEALCTGP